MDQRFPFVAFLRLKFTSFTLFCLILSLYHLLSPLTIIQLEFSILNANDMIEQILFILMQLFLP